MTRLQLLSFAMIATLASGCSSEKSKDPRLANANQPATVGTSGGSDLANQDAKDFVHHVGMVNMSELDLAQLAETRAIADDVKRFAQMMNDDHRASGEKLKTVASELKIDTPDQLDERHRDLRAALAKRSGPDFDHEYAVAMVEGHKDLVDQLEPRIDKKALEEWKLATNGKTTAEVAALSLLPDPSDNPTTMRINQFAAEMYPSAHAHLEAAKALENSLKKRSTRP